MGLVMDSVATRSESLAGTASAAEVQPDDRLVFPLHRRTVVQYAIAENGMRELRLFHGDKEISFDEADLFPFGEALATHGSFVAGSATDWAPGLAWDRTQPVLQQLVEAGVLVRSGLDELTPETSGGIRPSPLPPARCHTARSWTECEAVTRDLTGRAVELGWLELIVPVFRVAHAALDSEQRQVGEANVFPRALRLDVPTEWRTCNLPGSRYRSERPMNVTAMRTMRAHWPQMMAALLTIREGFLRRFPEARGAWTVGQAERLSVAVLAVPTYALMRRNAPVGMGDLHPALSSLFRITDGLRMTLHQMLFVPLGEAAWSPAQPVGIDDILDYAERNFSFHSEHGVCAGPRAMIREMLAVLLDGRTEHAHALLDPAVRAACDDLEPALDYGLLALQAHAALFSLWPAMSRAYERLETIVQDAPVSAAGGPLGALQARFRKHRETLTRATYLGNEAWRAGRDAAYSDMFRECARGVSNPVDTLPLDTLIAPAWSQMDRESSEILHAILSRRVGPESGNLAEMVTTAVMDFLLRQRAILRAAAAVQARVNRVLGRVAPAGPLDARDVNVHNLLHGAGPDRLPYLIDELAALFGLRIHLDTDRLAITDSEAAA